MLPQTLEGAWEDVRAHDAELRGLHDAELRGLQVRLIILTTDRQLAPTENIPAVPNQSMLTAMREAEKVQVGMNPKSGSDAVAIIRGGRAGAMYGDAELLTFDVALKTQASIVLPALTVTLLPLDVVSP